MPLPTLLVKGKLSSNDPSMQSTLDSQVPVEYIVNWLRDKSSLTGLVNRVLILRSETASGKSTLLPPAVYKVFKGTRGIICTQPRVITAIENVREIIKWNKDLVLGHNIGWSTKYNKIKPKRYGLLSATIGTLTAQLTSWSDEEIMNAYSVIMIDETHERDLNTDMTIYMLKNFLLRCGDRKECPMVIFMSATFDPKPFLTYFNLSDSNFIKVIGATAPIDERWDWNGDRTVSDYTRAASDVVKLIIESNPLEDPATADILIFMPGKKEFTETKKWLSIVNKELYNKHKVAFSILSIDGNAVRDRTIDYRYLSDVPVNKHQVTIDGARVIATRRVIISTNVAETGLTLSNLKYVIDSGFNRELEYNPVHNVNGLITKPAPQSRIRQRRGRSGRLFPGVFYPLYPKWIYDRLPELQLPQIATDDVSTIYLNIIAEQLKTKQSFNINDIDMITLPAPDASKASLEKLYSLGLINIDNTGSCGITLSEYGKHALAIGGRPEIARMVLSSFTYMASAIDCITMGAWTTLRKNTKISWAHVYQMGLSSVSKDIKHMYEIKLLISDDLIDGIIMMNAIKYIFKTNEPANAIKALRTWTESVGWDYNSALEFISTREDMINSYLSESFDLFRHDKNALSVTPSNELMNCIIRLKYCIADGFRCNLLSHGIIEGGHDTASKYLSTEYKSKLGLSVTVNDFMPNGPIKTRLIPKRILYSGLSLKLNPSGIYDVIPDYISVMDGYVPIDEKFTL